jgi:Cellulase (glycosyl hydrolase family 5)
MTLAAAAATAAVLACAAPAAAIETGINETLNQTVPTAEKADRLGADWVRLWVAWDQMEPSPGALHPHLLAGLQGGVDALKARGIKVLVVVQRAPAWASGFGSGTAPPRDPSTFASFIRRLALSVPGVDAWEIWNEPDEQEFWAGGADPARYAALLRAAYPAIKSVQPADVVVTGATTGNNYDFVEALYANGAGGSFDAVGVHTDTACLTNGPDRYYRDDRGRVGRYTFTGYREVHAVMSAHGDAAKPIWMTELGWNTQSTRRGSCNTGAWAGQKRLGVSKKRQARLLRAAYRCLAGDAFVHVGLWFGMQDIRGARHAAGYGLFNRRGRGKPSAKAFKRLRRGIRPKRCGGYIDRTPPQLSVIKPRNGQRFAGKLSVRVRASDNRGGTGLQRIYMSRNGRHVLTWGGRGGSIEPWWASKDWRPGVHTLTFRVRDNAQNETSVTVAVEKVRRRSSKR